MRLAIVLLLCVSSVAQAQAPTLSDGHSEAQDDFQERFRVTEAEYSLQVRRRRAAGWPLVILGVGTTLGAVALQGVQEDRLTVPIVGGMLAAVMIATGGALLIKARLMVGRKRRWLRSRDSDLSIQLEFSGYGALLRALW